MFTIEDKGPWGLYIHFPKVNGKYVIPSDMKEWLDNIYDNVRWTRTSNGCRKYVALDFIEDKAEFKRKFVL